MAHLAPQRATTFTEPGIEFREGSEFLILRFQPNAPPAVLDIFLDDTFLPAGRHIAEVGIKQIVGAHHGKARIDDASLALVDFVDRGLHVVVNAAPGNAAQGCEGARVGIE